MSASVKAHKFPLQPKSEPGSCELLCCREVLERHPLHFSFHDGKILKLCPLQHEQTWALNIKRGILSVLQTSPAATGGGTVEEVRVAVLQCALLAFSLTPSWPVSSLCWSHYVAKWAHHKIGSILHSCWKCEQRWLSCYFATPEGGSFLLQKRAR